MQMPSSLINFKNLVRQYKLMAVMQSTAFNPQYSSISIPISELETMISLLEKEISENYYYCSK